jgi:hypothetical protein
MPETAATITAEKLAQLTGFSIDDLAKLSRKGHLPRHRAGLYEQNLAIPGCFRAYKEIVSGAGGLPIYDNMSACAASTGLPLSIIRQAKKGGCPAFRSNRVVLAKLLKWLFSNNGEDQNWGDRLKKAQALREELRLEKDKGESLNKAEAQFAISKAMNALFDGLDRFANVEGPPDLKGMEEAACQKIILRAIEKLKEDFLAQLKEIG